MSLFKANSTYKGIPLEVIQQINYDATHVTAISLIVLLSVAILDTITLLPEDIRRWRAHRIRFFDLAYVWMRLTAIVSVAVNLVVELAGNVNSSFNCFVGCLVSAHFYGQALLGVNIIFIIRTLTIWNWNKVVGATIISLAAFQALAGFIGAPFAFTEVSSNPFDSPCLLIGFEQKYFTPAFALECAFDFSVFLLTLYKLYHMGWRDRSTISRLHRILLRDGLIYFIILLVCNLLNILFSTIPGITPLLTEIWNNVTIVAVSIAGSFIYHSCRRNTDSNRYDTHSLNNWELYNGVV